MEQSSIDWGRVAATIRHIAEAKAEEAKLSYPFLAVHGGPKAGIRRALKITDRRTFEARWDGTTPYTVAQVAVIADLLGVRTADLLNPDE